MSVIEMLDWPMKAEIFAQDQSAVRRLVPHSFGPSPRAASIAGPRLPPRTHFRDINEVRGTMEVRLDRVLPAGDEVFVLLHVHLDAPRGDLALDGPIFETVRLKDGRISRIRLFLDERAALEA